MLLVISLGVWACKCSAKNISIKTMPLEILDGVFGMDHPLMENSQCAGLSYRRAIQCTI
jgi:hypothetical protein